MRSLAKVLVTIALVPILLCTAANAGVTSKAVGRAASKRAAAGTAVKKETVARQKLGPLHTVQKPTVLERATNRPATDKTRGLGGSGKHVFTRHPKVGRRGTAEHVQKELNIPHPVKKWEKVVVPPGVKYHERPIRGGEKNMREVIIHGRIPGKAFVKQERLSHAKK